MQQSCRRKAANLHHFNWHNIRAKSATTFGIQKDTQGLIQGWNGQGVGSQYRVSKVRRGRQGFKGRGATAQFKGEVFNPSISNLGGSPSQVVIKTFKHGQGSCLPRLQCSEIVVVFVESWFAATTAAWDTHSRVRPRRSKRTSFAFRARIQSIQ